MKKKEVIAEVAFLGVSPALQSGDEVELPGGLTVQRLTPANLALLNARDIKMTLEEALPDIHDDEEIRKEQFPALIEALTIFRDNVLNAMIIPEVSKKTEEDLNEKIAALQRLRESSKE